MKRILYHNYLFTFGFIYYLIVPLIVVKFDLFEGFPGMEFLYDYNYHRFCNIYLLSSLIVLISFFCGSYTASKIYSWNKQRLGNKRELIVLNVRRVVVLLAPVCFLGFFQIINNRNLLFQGYLVEQDISLTGTIATVQLYILFLTVYDLYTSHIIIKPLYLLLVFFSIILLGLGSRMYAIIPFVSLIIFKFDNNKLKIRHILIVITTVIVLLLLVGLIRTGEEIEIEKMLYIGFAEPTFTWISIESMFQYNKHFDLFSIPYNYISTILNFIPTFLFPNKSEYIEEISLIHDTPLGATNILVSLISNFGIIGSGIFMMMLGYILTFIRKRENSFFFKTFYICVCGVLPFQFFRDNFSIINKVVFMNFFLLPYFLFRITKYFIKYNK